MNAADLPTLNAVLNALCAILLLLGFIMIKQNKREAHKKIMLSAVIVSGLFLISYVAYHYQVGSVPYPHHDWTRTLYFIILIPHVILAAVMVPFIIAAIRFALLGKFDKHKKLVKWVWPVWMFVSLSGLAVYTMLYQL